MPAQTRAAQVTARGVDSTRPLTFVLADAAGVPVDLTLAEVRIDIAWASYSHYYAPYGRIVTDGLCDLADQQTNPGQVSYPPGEGELFPPGQYHVAFNITYANGVFDRIPALGRTPMLIRARVGGDGNVVPQGGVT